MSNIPKMGQLPTPGFWGGRKCPNGSEIDHMKKYINRNTPLYNNMIYLHIMYIWCIYIYMYTHITLMWWMYHFHQPPTSMHSCSCFKFTKPHYSRSPPCNLLTKPCQIPNVDDCIPSFHGLIHILDSDISMCDTVDSQFILVSWYLIIKTIQNLSVNWLINSQILTMNVSHV